MLTANEIRLMIVQTIHVGGEEAVIEARLQTLLAVLREGERCVIPDTGDALTLAGIPMKADGNSWLVDELWLKNSGCKIPRDGVIIFPKRLKAWSKK